MSLKENINWNDIIPKIHPEELVKGNEDSKHNIQSNIVADRTRWIRDQLENNIEARIVVIEDLVNCNSNCSATCKGSCQGSCRNTCTETCKNTCIGGCETVCGNNCTGTCSSSCTNTSTGKPMTLTFQLTPVLPVTLSRTSKQTYTATLSGHDPEIHFNSNVTFAVTPAGLSVRADVKWNRYLTFVVEPTPATVLQKYAITFNINAFHTQDKNQTYRYRIIREITISV